MAAITPPPPDPRINVSPTFQVLNQGTILLRIFDPTRYNTQATSFRHNGPFNRFDHQRDLWLNSVPLIRLLLRLLCKSHYNFDPERGINYWGCTLSCCLVEVFGDTKVIETENKKVAFVILTEPIKLLDLRGSGAMRAGTVSAIAQTAQRKLSQAWSRYFYEHPELYGEIDGLIFTNSHNEEPAIALYERAQPQLEAAKVNSLPLNHPGLETAIADCAAQNGLSFYS